MSNFDRYLWSLRHFKQLGLDQFLRCLARLPPNSSSRTLVLRDLLHRLPDGLPPLLPRHFHRTPHGRRLLQAAVHRREYHPAHGHLHDVAVQDVLAVYARTGHLHRRGQRIPLLSQLGFDFDVLPQEESPCVGHRRLRLCHRRFDLPGHGERIAAEDRVPLDYPGNWSHPARKPGGLEPLEQAPDKA